MEWRETLIITYLVVFCIIIGAMQVLYMIEQWNLCERWRSLVEWWGSRRGSAFGVRTVGHVCREGRARAVLSEPVEIAQVWVALRELKERLAAIDTSLRSLRDVPEWEDDQEKPFECDCNDPTCPIAHGEEVCGRPCGPGLYEDIPLCDGCAEHLLPD